MRDLVVTENITVDGFVAPMEGWFDPSDSDEDLLAVSTAHRAAADALVMGRVTYEEFASFWPFQTDDTTGNSEYLDNVAKYVVTSTLESAEWVNSTILRGPAVDELTALKKHSGRDIVITGSVSLATSLLPSGIVDVYRLFVYPVVQGHGRRLFPDGMAATLDLVDCRSFSSGVVLQSYRRRD